MTFWEHSRPWSIMVDACESEFFRPFAQIRDNVRPVLAASYFDGDFYDFQGPADADVAWDLPIIQAVVDTIGARSVLDVGCGAGRILETLLPGREPAHVVGVDTSSRAIAAGRERLGDRATLLEADVHDLAWLSSDRFEAAVLGNVTINSFPTAEAVLALLATMHRLLEPDGELLVIAFGSGETAKFERFRQLCDGLPFIDREGNERFILRGIDYQAADRMLLHNYYIAGQPDALCAPGPGALAVHREHLWTLEELAPLAAAAGWSVRVAGTVPVVGAGAGGWSCECLLFSR